MRDLDPDPYQIPDRAKHCQLLVDVPDEKLIAASAELNKLSSEPGAIAAQPQSRPASKPLTERPLLLPADQKRTGSFPPLQPKRSADGTSAFEERRHATERRLWAPTGPRRKMAATSGFHPVRPFGSPILALFCAALGYALYFRILATVKATNPFLANLPCRPVRCSVSDPNQPGAAAPP